MSYIKSPLSGWVGGKFHLAKTIIPKIPEHAGYVEPFAGGAWILFRKPQSAAEILNDIDKDVITLYRVIQKHLPEFIRYMQWALVSRDEFNRLQKVAPETLTDIERSCRFFYLQKLAFGGKVANSPVFGTSATKPARLNLTRLETDLWQAHQRLAQVTIECLPYSEVIERYDRPETFFYCDPPYYNCEDYYGKDIFNKDDFKNLYNILSQIKGQFLLSINDVEPIRELFKNFKIESVDTFYSVSKNKMKPVKEILISNY